LVCVHGTLGDFRTWYAVLGPLSQKHRVIAVSLRRFFPSTGTASADDYKMAQHVDDVIGFIEQVAPQPVDLMGHSRGGHIAFRAASSARTVAQAGAGRARRPFDATLDPAAVPDAPSEQAARIAASADKIRAGDVDGALRGFVDGIDGEGAWARLPAAAKQQLRDNVFTLIGQIHEARRPYSLTDVQAIRTPTLFVGGGDTKGSLAAMPRVLRRTSRAPRQRSSPAPPLDVRTGRRRILSVVLDFLAK